MPFESGAVSFRMFYVPNRLPRDCVSDFAAKAAPPINTLGRESITGWVTGRHLLDREIVEDTAIVGGYLRLTLMKAERKVPEALLRAECMMEEIAQQRAREVAYLKREIRSEIRREVLERLLPGMPPTLTGIPMACGRQDDILYAGATTDKQADAFELSFREATGITLVAVTPETAAMQRKGLSVRDLAPSSFSPECEDEETPEGLGLEFLTWLWFFSDARGGIMKTDGGSEFAVFLEGPLTFVMQGNGAHVAVLRQGTPEVSAEAKTALLSGKKLRSARVTIARGDESWRATLNAEHFVFSGLSLPKGEALDAVSRFQERMLSIEVFREALLRFFDRFLDERSDRSKWQQTQQDIHNWVRGRPSR